MALSAHLARLHQKGKLHLKTKAKARKAMSGVKSKRKPRADSDSDY